MRRRSVTVLAALVLVGTVGSPAHAQTKVRRDQVGEDRIGSTWDLRSVKVQNNARRFALTVRVSEVRRDRTAVTSAIVPARDATSDPDEVRNYYLSTLPTSGGRWTSELGLYDETGDQSTDTDIACPGMRTTADRGRRGFIRVVIPQRCFGADRGRMLTFAETYDVEVTREADGMRHAVARAAARRGDGPVVDDDDLFDSLPGNRQITTRRGR